jgi:hypothetical protein
MTTPTHVAFDLGIFLILSNTTALNLNYYDLALILASNLIDLDHLFSKPIYHPKRNPFITHGIHKRWILLTGLSLGLLFIRPTMFLGIGLLAHLLLDYIYVRREKL